jgi:hypothetical protein
MQQNPTSDNTDVRIIDDGDLRKYYTQLPNIIFTLGLSPYALTLYAYFKKVAGADSGGACWQKTATIAKGANMSAGAVSNAKAELSKPRPELNGKPLIVIDERSGRHGGKPLHVIRLVNIWTENMAAFEKPISQDAPPISRDEIGRSPHEIAISPHEIKKNPSEEKPNEEKHTHTTARLAPVAASVPSQAERVCVSGSKFSKSDLKRYARNQSHIQNPAGWASKAHRTGDWDDDVQDWFEREGVQPDGSSGETAANGVSSTVPAAAPAMASVENCPDCHGLGFIYPDSKNPSAGVKKCHHTGLQRDAA